MPIRLRTLLCCCLTVFSITLTVPARAQQETTPNSTNHSEQIVEGAVVSSGRDTLVVHSDDDQYHLFTYARGATHPKIIVPGSRVRVTAGEPEENGTRAASNVTVLNAASRPQGGASSDKGNQAAAVPPKVREVESDIRREARRWRLGARAGAAFDPELFMFGVHSQMGPIFHPRVQFRPSAEFDFGEVTDLIALNLEGVYRFATPYRGGRWTPYVGLGPALIFIHQNFQHGRQIDFGNFDYETGFNVLAGVQSRRGMFVELKTSLYSGPAPKLRLIFGYTF